MNARPPLTTTGQTNTVDSRRIAVIGSGIAGMAAAWYLSGRHEVTLFEADACLGGHTATVDVELAGRHYAIDTGFIVFNDWTYPHFQRLMQRLGVLSQPTEMSFSVHETARDFEYNGHTLTSLFAQRRNLLRPSFYGLLREILRFNREAIRAMDDGALDPAMTLGTWLEARGFDGAFQRRYLLPMGAAIWSASLSDLRDFPLQFFVRFFRHHGLLSVNDRPRWYTLVGGSRSYIPLLTAPYAGRIRLSTPVRGIRRLGDGVAVRSALGVERFDEVVMACHADQALALLEDPSPAERELLGALTYRDNEVVLHTDTRLLPRRRRAWASWNYRLDGRDETARVSVTYDMNILQRLAAPHTFCVTLNDSEAIAPEKVLGRFTYAHPQFTLAGEAAKARHAEISGTAFHTHYCGAYWRNGFHEDGVWSALRVAHALGGDEAGPEEVTNLLAPVVEGGMSA
ncbi:MULTISPECIES: FAD-dependent oxidoreductase [unclassified Halomonas]|uniref:NAD(P)/FAD-dependent oxidoreductase n=1 Tax=unclassified Halomonas TaxID=2609666 RepID=UPI00288782B4|nr:MULTISPECIES: FAD-dependent oxidoreductase [unclassified Halomonas]MDT0502204.1 FAD-dependent oxidoreductase [Halomonas sp. PAR7]MDT0513380.1 FAD-dependent oxidoreductase [Halomonas sp. LES1]MDT0591854.1 FAD-dependent oxidoreductase [Halomonas sp. PAR8]